MSTREARTLSRDVEVAAIPYGDKLTLTAGTTVYITQSLGGSHTAMTSGIWCASCGPFSSAQEKISM